MERRGAVKHRPTNPANFRPVTFPPPKERFNMNTIDPTDDSTEDDSANDPIEQDLIRDTIEQDDYMDEWESDDPTNESIEQDDYMGEWELDDPRQTDGTKAEYERLNAETKTEYSQAWNEATGEPGLAAALAVLPEYPEPTKVAPEPVKALSPLPTLKTFGSAFAQARRAGLAQFWWQGKRYTTQTKEEAAAPKAPAVPKLASAAPVPLRPAAAAQATKPMSTAATSTKAAPKPMTYTEERQKAYDDWMTAKSANRTWYGGAAQGTPSSKAAEIEAERRYTELLRNPRR